MHVLIAHHTKIPVSTYGGTERIMWWLGKTLVQMGHEVTFLVNANSHCPFARIIKFQDSEEISRQIPSDIDLVHFFFQPRENIEAPHLVTNQGNVPDAEKELPLHINTVFVSEDHAHRHGATCYVHNGIDTEDYGKPDLHHDRSYLHFLAKASWRAKNVRGALKIAKMAGYPLHVMGGNRLNSKASLTQRLTTRAIFHGMVDDTTKLKVLGHSRGLLFPVTWHEPFGIALLESLYFGCPVFGTPFGSLPEIVSDEVGYLSNSYTALATAVQEKNYSPIDCHERVMKHFTAQIMTKNYLKLYEKIGAGQSLNTNTPTAKNTVNEPKSLSISD